MPPRVSRVPRHGPSAPTSATPATRIFSVHPARLAAPSQACRVRMGLHQLFGNAGKFNAVGKGRGCTGRQASRMLELHCRFGARTWFEIATIAERTARTSTGPKAPMRSAGISAFASENCEAALRPLWSFTGLRGTARKRPFAAKRKGMCRQFCRGWGRNLRQRCTTNKCEEKQQVAPQRTV